MENLLSSDEKVRRETISQMMDKSEAKEFTEDIPRLLEIIVESSDEYTTLQISSAISNYLERNPMDYSKFDENVRICLNKLGDRELTDEGYDGSSAQNIFKHVGTYLQTNPMAVSNWLPILFKLSNAKGSIKYAAAAPIITVSLSQPMILKDYVPQIFNLINNGFGTLMTSLIHLQPYNPEEFTKQVPNLVKIFQTDPTSSSMALMILNEISKQNGELLAEYLTPLSMALNNPSLSASVLMILTNIAEKKPEALEPFIDQLGPLPQYNSNLLYQIPNILGLVGNLSDENAVKVLGILDGYLPIANDMAVPMILTEFRNIGEKFRNAIEPYIEKIRTYESSPQETIRDQAKMIVDNFEGRDIRSIASTIEEQNKMIAEAAVSVDSLMAYVDDNVSMLKEFIAEVAKKLPTPKRFSTEGVIRKTLILHFVCDKHEDRCLFPEERPFTTETKDWSKWLKIAFSAVKLGKSLIIPAAIGDAGKAVKDAYNAYKDKYDMDFLVYISEPFLTSKEQDKLINQLRDAKFFEIFHYDAQIAGWVCTMCNL